MAADNVQLRTSADLLMRLAHSASTLLDRLDLERQEFSSRIAVDPDLPTQISVSASRPPT